MPTETPRTQQNSIRNAGEKDTPMFPHPTDSQMRNAIRSGTYANSMVGSSYYASELVDSRDASRIMKNNNLISSELSSGGV